MHIIPKARAYRLVDAAQKSWDYASLAEVAGVLLGVAGSPRYSYKISEFLGNSGFVVIDDEGDIVPRYALVGAMDEVLYERRAKRLRPDHVFRCGPVPWRGRGRGYRQPYRSVNTFQEISAQSWLGADLDDAEYTGYVGRIRDLPTAYSDVARGWQRGWKAQRKTQWKGR